MIPTVAIIFFAFVMQEAMTDIGIADYIITLVQPHVNAVIFPLVTFLVVAILNFSTGSVWGIPGHRCANPAAAGGEHRHKSAPGHGGDCLGRHARQPCLLLFRCHGIDIQLL